VRRLRLLAVVALLVLVPGCRLDVAVGIDAKADGSGRVRVEVTADAELVKAAGTDSALVDDLKQAGWEVEGPTTSAGGAASIVATKGFSDPDGARQAFAELGGPFRELTLSRKRTILRTTTSFRGTVDFSKGIEAFGDPGVAQVLGGSDLGIATKDIGATAGGRIEDTFGVTVAARLPGGITSSNAPTSSGTGAMWRLAPGVAAELEAESAAWNTTNIAGLLVAMGAIAGLVGLALATWRSRSPG